MEERLQKIIARAGIASRRHAEDLIRSGMVTVNGQTVTELGSKADEATDHIKVSGKLLHPGHDRVYLVLNKPPEVVSTMTVPASSIPCSAARRRMNRAGTIFTRVKQAAYRFGPSLISLGS